MEQGATERCIAAMSDPGMFERLATAVLRAADSQCGGLIHTGVNLDGRTVPAPEDGIAFVEGANPRHMIVMHHTTCGRTALKKKWLHGFANAGPSTGGKPSTPPGDLVKATRLFEKQKQQIPNLRATLILTTNKDPDAELVCRVNSLGAKAGLEVRIWSGSRLAHFLDYDATGQWIRQRFLGIDQERLSGELLCSLSGRSLSFSNLQDDSTSWIDRQLDRRLEDAVGSDVVFIVAEPGLGKSVACYKRLRSHIENGGSGIIISHRTIAEAPSLELAIDRTLRHLHPSLAQGQGREALSLACPLPNFLT